MANESETSSEEPLTPPVTEEVPPPPRRQHRRLLWIVLAVIISPIALLGLWAVITLNYSYSKGDRAGYVQKFSRKGWICKTYEGQLAMVNVPGAMQEKWDFSVRDDSVARLISASMGKRVALVYDQHRGVPTSCFGETEYFVTGIQILGQ